MIGKRDKKMEHKTEIIEKEAEEREAEREERENKEKNKEKKRKEKIFDKIKDRIRKHKRYIVFSIGGVITFLLDIIITAFLTEVIRIWYMYSYAIALFTNIILLFFYHSFVTFKDLRKNPVSNFLKFLSTYSLAIFLNWSLVFIITLFVNVHYLIVVAAVTISLSVLNYTLNKKWVFDIHKNIKREFEAKVDLELVREINLKKG